MPYISGFRAPLDRAPVKDVAPRDVGELTYVLYRICLNFWKRNGARYQQIAEIRGALSGTNDELGRRVFGPYEDQKISENGDVV